MNKKVLEYINKQKPSQKEIIERLRDIILRTYPDIEEELKMGVPWYEGKYYIVGLKDHVNLGFSIEGLSEEEKKLFEGTGKTMKHIKIFSPEEINEEKIVKLLKVVRKV
ncbi:DUF1801 domain-containing protein [Methanococcoides methylutens]|uniref:YdhG-like domain-containing protein n=1 Tax=Methanococcoides methylutens MM1 TaxID=1434104 RepID=A0A0E3SQZ7_METMT|nr:DUF1801 domain-containing protein [Methanococcoides methylutens]AKB84522.1 hypothetical protein MCMEM_0469 [Methanococcoides methylutens MM1]